MSTQKCNDGHIHEAMHVAWILTEMVDDYILATPVCDDFPDVKMLAEEAHKKLFDLYQMLGAHWKDE